MKATGVNPTRQMLAAIPQERIVLATQTLGELYRALVGKANREAAAARGTVLDLAKITALDATAKAAMETFASHHSGRLEGYFYLPLRGRKQDLVLALSATDGMPANWIPISPWLTDYQDAR